MPTIDQPWTRMSGIEYISGKDQVTQALRIHFTFVVASYDLVARDCSRENCTSLSSGAPKGKGDAKSKKEAYNRRIPKFSREWHT
eukprot:8703856-Karenia_brevis.AAC.1